MEPLRIACEGNVAKGCENLALVYWTASKGRNPDSMKAEEFMKKACDKEDYDACWILSTWFGIWL
jgi:TPR repeat protein